MSATENTVPPQPVTVTVIDTPQTHPRGSLSINIDFNLATQAGTAKINLRLGPGQDGTEREVNVVVDGDLTTGQVEIDANVDGIPELEQMIDDLQSDTDHSYEETPSVQEILQRVLQTTFDRLPPQVKKEILIRAARG